jgi:hypothetical protein
MTRPRSRGEQYNLGFEDDRLASSLLDPHASTWQEARAALNSLDAVAH